MLNEHQVRHVVAMFAHVDKLLSDVERHALDELSPYARDAPDLTPHERRLLLSFVALTRQRMLGALDRLRIRRPQPSGSARWGILSTLHFAEVALADVGGEHLRGYGPVDPLVAIEVDALASDLRAVLSRARALLHEHDAGGLVSSISGVPGTAGEVLRAVEHLSGAHGLAEIRPLLAAAAERATGITFDVGVFGRVSAGKSSLINAVIGAPVLPIGATPVTAVPIRLMRGDARCRVHFLDGASREVDTESIAAYATEEQNPGNRIGVRSIDVWAPNVPEGLRLLDTPGVGSLTTSGPAQAFAWLPRCDLGLVLIAAGTAPGREDLALVTGLRNAGIDCFVLVSKADLLPPADLARTVAYVRHELGQALGAELAPAVRAVSTAPAATHWLQEFREAVLEPVARDYARAAKGALRVRLRRLLHATATAMKGRRGEADDRVVALQRARNEAGRQLREATDRIAESATALRGDAADAVLAAWQRNESGQDAARHVIVRAAGDAMASVRGIVDSAQAPATAKPSVHRAGQRLPPIFDPELLDKLPSLAPPSRFALGLGGRTAAARQLESLGPQLSSALGRYASALYDWGRGALEEIAVSAWDAEPLETSLPTELANLAARLDAETLAEPDLPASSALVGEQPNSPAPPG